MAEEGQLAVIEFKGSAAPSVQRLESSRGLRRYLDQSTDDIHQRVFVLEGLPRNFIQILGAKLKVPPDFFASHWSCPVAGYLLNRTPRHYDIKNRFVLAFPRLHRARIRALVGDYQSPFYFTETSVYRLLSHS
jgi:hypothetical protein